MSTLPSAISTFLYDHHVVGLATVSAGEPWAASCFYAYDPAADALIVLSSEQTRHGAAMLAHGKVAGTIAGQPTAIIDIRGLQFAGQALLLEGEAAARAYALYCVRHPVARLKKSTVWRIALAEAKLTNNASLFGHKTVWRRDGGAILENGQR